MAAEMIGAARNATSLRFGVRPSLANPAAIGPEVCDLARRAGRAALPLRCDRAPVAVIGRQPDRRARADPEHPRRPPARMTGGNVTKDPFAKIHRVEFAHPSPPAGSESDERPYGNPPMSQVNDKPL